MASWLLNHHYTVYGEESQTILRGDAGSSMAGEYRGGEAFTPSVIEGKRKPRTAAQKNAESGACLSEKVWGQIWG